MDATTILDKADAIDWDDDQGADVLYLSIGAPRPAMGLDIGDGLVPRFDEERREVVGLTVIGPRDRLLRGLDERD